MSICRTVCLFSISVIAVLGATGRVRADIGYIPIEVRVREATTVVHARVLAAHEERGSFEVVQVLKGSLGPGKFLAAPFLFHSCIDPPKIQPLPVNAEVVLFLRPPNDGIHGLPGDNAGWYEVRKEERSDLIAAILRIVELEEIPEAKQRFGLYLEAMESPNPVLRRIACSAFLTEVTRSKAVLAEWEPELVKLMNSTCIDARRTGFRGLREIRSERALQGLLAAVDDDDRQVQVLAIEALAQYDTEVTASKLIGVMDRPHLTLSVVRSCSSSRRWEVRDALLPYLRYGDSLIRHGAARSLADSLAGTNTPRSGAVVMQLRRLQSGVLDPEGVTTVLLEYAALERRQEVWNPPR